MDVVLAVGALAAVVVGFYVMLWRLRREETATDWCTECGCPLTERTRWTLTAEAPPTMEGGVLGGSYTAADYCKIHAPEGAVRAR